MADNDREIESEERGSSAERPQREGRDDRRGGGRRAPGQRQEGFRRGKVCQFCADKVSKIDYKDLALLRRFVSERGRIYSRRKTATCAKHQRMLSTAIKRARHMALLPYTAEHVRVQNP